jgi:hypothetical protein
MIEHPFAAYLVLYIKQCKLEKEVFDSEEECDCFINTLEFPYTKYMLCEEGFGNIGKEGGSIIYWCPRCGFWYWDGTEDAIVNEEPCLCNDCNLKEKETKEGD